MKTAISIPDALFESAERLADRLGISRSEFYQRAVARFVQEHSDDSITKALNEVYGDDQGDGLLDPALEALQFASVKPGDEW